MIYLVGDLQGCCDAFERLLDEVAFSPSRDELYLLGDLVNRGPASLRTLETIARFDGAVHCVLGNHDLHLLAVANGTRRPGKHDTLNAILDSDRRHHWLHWLRQQPLARQAHGWLMVHAGVLPAWDAADVLRLADEVHQQLRGDGHAELLGQMYGNLPDRWDPALRGIERWRLVINTLTRARFVHSDGRLDFDLKEGADAAPPGLLPWFDAPDRRTADTPIAFGHWSTLGLINCPQLLALDTGCVWGGALTAARIDGGRRDIISVRCAQTLAPI